MHRFIYLIQQTNKKSGWQSQSQFFSSGHQPRPGLGKICFILGLPNAVFFVLLFKSIRLEHCWLPRGNHRCAGCKQGKRRIRMRKKILVLTLSMGIAAAVSASVISVNMTDGGSLGTSAGQTAGAVLAGNWNEIGNSGAAVGGTDLNNLTDNSGAASGVTLVQGLWVGGWWNSDAYPSGFSGTIGNDMYGNFHDFTAADGLQTFTFDNLNAGVGALYDVYIYSARGFANTGVTQFDVNGETKYLANENTVGDYAESGWASQALAEANPDSGNYVRFQNVSLNTLVVGVSGLEDLTNGGVAGSVAGLQIVAVPEPTTLGLLLAAGGGLVCLRRMRKS
jgi:hypothetical protein